MSEGRRNPGVHGVMRRCEVWKLPCTDNTVTYPHLQGVKRGEAVGSGSSYLHEVIRPHSRRQQGLPCVACVFARVCVRVSACANKQMCCCVRYAWFSPGT